MDERLPGLMGPEQEKAYADHLAEVVTERMKQKHGRTWGDAPKPWHERVGSPDKTHDDEPVWYDLKQYPPGSTIRSTAPDLVCGGSAVGIGVTTSVQKRHKNGKPVVKIRKTRVWADRIVEQDGTTRVVRRWQTRVEHLPVFEDICKHSGKPLRTCCPAIWKHRQQQQQWRQARDRAEEAQRGPVTPTRELAPVARGINRIHGIGPKVSPSSDAIDPHGRRIVGTPGQLRAEARRHGKYLSAGPGAE